MSEIDSERRALARAIWKAGTAEPDLLAEYLIREGWELRATPFQSGVVSTVNSVNAIQLSTMEPLMRVTTAASEAGSTNRPNRSEL